MKEQNSKDEINEGPKYDKVLKENARKIVTPLIEEKLGVTFARMEARQEKMQTTIEREMDFYYEVETVEEVLFFLHLEFQSQDEADMVFRIGEYVAMARKRWKKPIKPIVIYLGKEPSKMVTQLPVDQVYTGFDLLSMRDLNPFRLIDSSIPEMVILAILSNIPKNGINPILTMMIARLKQLCTKKSDLNKFANQLIMLSKLRKLEKITAQKISEMLDYKMEEDGIYQMGAEAMEAKVQEAMEAKVQEAKFYEEQERKRALKAEKRVEEAKERQRESIKKLLKTEGWNISEVSKIFDVPEKTVEEIFKEINRK